MWGSLQFACNATRGKHDEKNTQVNIPFPQHKKCPLLDGPYEGPPSANVWDLHWGQKLLFWGRNYYSLSQLSTLDLKEGPCQRHSTVAPLCSYLGFSSEKDLKIGSKDIYIPTIHKEATYPHIAETQKESISWDSGGEEKAWLDSYFLQVMPLEGLWCTAGGKHNRY